ncbi:MAG: aldo/keto reductase, partial [Granulosicoccaceae bacterium]
MQYSALGQTGVQISEICLGTMTFGEQCDLAQSHRILDRALEHGINFLDAAELYPSPMRADTCGRTEQYIGEWLADRGGRDKLVIATKV